MAKTGRPSKFDEKMCEQVEKLAKLGATDISVPIVYGLLDCRTGTIVYVGQTINAKRRFEKYRNPNSCHNPQLAAWLRETGEYVRVAILEDSPADIDASERDWINRLRPNLLNLVHGGKQAWRQHISRPWMAGIGIKCPSDLVIQRITNVRRSLGKPAGHVVEAVKKRRNEMTIRERVLFEVGLCMDNLHRDKASMEKWLDATTDRLLAVLEAPENRAVSGHG